MDSFVHFSAVQAGGLRSVEEGPNGFLSHSQRLFHTTRDTVTRDHPVRFGLHRVPEDTASRSAAFSDLVRRVALVSIHAYQSPPVTTEGIQLPVSPSLCGIVLLAYVCGLFSKDNSLSTVFSETL